MLYNSPFIDHDKVETVTTYIMQAEKDGVARVAILATLANILFYVYSSNAYNAKLL